MLRDPGKLEMWGGIECTLNRVGDRFIDQFARGGHLQREGDLDLVAGLGIRRLRYPLHWERVQPLSSASYDWSFPDRQLESLSDVQIDPIAGFLHHGSGPAWTNLLDPDFPARLAEYSLAVATRYPELRDFTPVNEPLTTARFSGLYGHWFPHRMDDRSFVLVFLNQIEGVIRSMQAIRSVRPNARLIQTEDIGKAFSTPELASQASFENERRWLTFDLLSGHFNETHPLWHFMADAGGTTQQLEFIAANPCPPELLGVNYYVTSERWLDENLALHPPETHGGNGRTAYADVAAVRGCPEGASGIANILREVWARYHMPLAVTESHLGCTREEQMRWLGEAWRAAEQLRREDIDVRAVTAWALLGAYDWNSLVTCEDGVYEPGAFDVRGVRPRPTALAKAVNKMAIGESFYHPVIDEPGWWRRSLPAQVAPSSHAPPILILGGAGNLGRALNRICQSRGLTCKNLSRYEADVCDPAGLRRAIEQHRPWAVINAAGYTLIDDAETDRERCFEVNEGGAVNAARVCAEMGLRYVVVSTDLVFDGSKAASYVESDATGPLGVYGASKAAGERGALCVHPAALVVRTSPLFDSWSAGDFTAQVLLQSGVPLVLPEGRISPTYAVDFCHALLDLLIDEESGVWHLANGGAVTWREFAELLVETFHVSTPVYSAEVAVAMRPPQSVLISERATWLPSLANAMARFRDDVQPMLRVALEQRLAVAG